jgi:FKBP-type peptidyl-prolyl cis-trans isomerase
MKTLTLILVALAALAIVGCGDDSSGDSAGSGGATATVDENGSNAGSAGAETFEGESTTETFEEESDTDGPDKPKPKVVVPDGPPPKNLIVKDIEVGDGDEIGEHDHIEVDYVTVRYSDGKEKESSWDGTASEIIFVMDDIETIEGWERGMEGMKVGGRRELIVPNRLAYNNSEGALIYVVDLLDIK